MSDEPKLEFWINLYHGDRTGAVHQTREKADLMALPERVRCVRVVEVPVDKGYHTCETCRQAKWADEMFTPLQCLLCWEKQCAQVWHEAIGNHNDT